MRVRKVEDADLFFKEIGMGLAKADNHKIECVNWPDDFPDKPDVSFAITHTGDEICIKFFVDEQYTMARTTENNGPVWTDSCVEFFIGFDDAGYYNFEFNCIGAMLLGFRRDRENFVHADADVISTIERVSTLGNNPIRERSGGNQWSLTVIIPAKAFFKHDIKSFSGIKAKGNFYKCGDDLTVPHYLSWKPVKTPTPNFHAPRYFGGIDFE